MKLKHKFLTMILCALIGPLPKVIYCQQVPVPLEQDTRPGFMNPGHFPRADLNEIKVAHQQRGLRFVGWQSSSQFLHFQSRPTGSTGRFSWGLLMSNDIIHTENRVAMSASLAVALLKNRETSLSLGAAAGLINWNSNYQKTQVYDRGELLVNRNTNFFELDAAIGLEFQHKTPKVHLDAAISGNQLTGSLLTSRFDGINVLPHINAGGGALFASIYNLYIGPRLSYRNTLNQRDTTIRAGTLDVGFKAELDRQNLWFSGLYRIDNSALTLGFGLEIFKSDTVGDQFKSGRYGELFLLASQPLAGGDAFGPSFEVGLSFALGKRGYNHLDTLSFARIFWKSEVGMIDHKEKFLNPISPKGLAGKSEVSDKYVFLDYSFPDDQLNYLGDSPIISGTRIPKIGAEWTGLDGLLSGLVEFSIGEALHPDTSRVRDPENLEPLKRLIWVEIGCEMKDDAISAGFGSDVVYEGEFGTNNPTDDTLFIDIVFDDRDTTVALVPNNFISNLELACLKLYAMRGKLQYELEKDFGDDYLIETERKVQQDWDEFEIEDWKPSIRIKKLRILSDRPNLQSFAEDYIVMKFVRYKRH